MATDNQTSLRFSLKESVWFQKGQEVAELLSISLDPDIAIQERDYEVVVKGELQLAAEYIAEESEEASFSLRELSPVRTIDNVYTREDGINELSHSFPLEISIPRSRVRAVDELYVTVDSFDYEMPEKDCLQLIADVSIWGLCEQEREAGEAEEEKPEEQPESKRDEGPPVFLEEEQEREQEEEEDLFEPFQLEARKIPDEEQQGPFPEPAAPQVELFGRVEEAHQQQPQGQTKQEEEEFEYSNRDENALYLTKLFTKEREEEFTKVRMYFVQQGDTTESIAERYGISVQQLTRVNNIDELYVSEGQILYIPVPKSKVTS
ncbi:MAG: stage VI sporulation protein D [Ectobacillus sp.]